MKWKECTDGFCDKCNCKIIEGRCDCGIWIKPEEPIDPLTPLEDAIIAYNRMNIDYPLTGDHHSGTCIVLFKGDYDLCKKVKKFIEEQ